MEQEKVKSFKEHKDKEIGWHGKVKMKILKYDNKKLLPSAKVIYAYISMYADAKTKESIVSAEEMEKYLGYSDNTIRAAIEKLEDYGFLIRESSSGQKSKFSGIRTPIKHYERFSSFFLKSQIIKKNDKEFLLLISPYIFRERDVIQYNNKEIAEKLGMSPKYIGDRIKNLKKLGYWLDTKGKKDRHVFISSLQIDGATEVMNENIELRKKLQAYE